MSDLSGRVIGQYTIHRKLGAGGMAVVYLAHHKMLQRDVALKVLPVSLTADKNFVARFLQEARSAARMDHPNIVTIYEVGEEDNTYYMALAYIEGESMAELLARSGGLSPTQVATIIQQIGSALDYAHQRGIIHRDVKPGNIMLNRWGKALLMDFGIAKATTETKLTRTGLMVGTPAYMSPEQAQGQEVDKQSDQYSLAVVAYRALTGEVPFKADSELGVLYQHVNTPPDLNKLPPQFREILNKALAKKPEQRFASVAAFGQALHEVTESGQTSISTVLSGSEETNLFEPTPTLERNTPPPPTSNRTLIWVGVAMLALLIIGGGLGFAILNNGGDADSPITQVTAEATQTTPSSTPTESVVVMLDEATEEPPTVTPSPTDGLSENDILETRVALLATQRALEATDTPAPTATATEASTSTPTSTPIPTEEPTVTPTPRPSPTVAPDTPTPSRPIDPDVVLNFEESSLWLVGDQKNGQLINSTEQVAVGESSGKLSYDFPATSDNFVVLMQTQVLPGEPTALTAQVYGDGSGHYLNVWVRDNDGETWQLTFGQIEHIGWAEMTALFDNDGNWPNGRIGGTGDNQLGYPAQFRAFVLDGVPDNVASEGEIYLDDVRVTEALIAAAPVATTQASPQRQNDDSPNDTTSNDTPPDAPTGLSGKLAYPVDNGLGRYDVFISSIPDGTVLGKIEGARQPHYRADGQRLLVNAQNNNQGENLMEFTATGGFLDVVSDGPTDAFPSYHPDGNRIAFGNPQLVRGADGQYNPYLFVQCTAIRPSYESNQQCREIATFGVLVPPGFVGEIIGEHPVWTGIDYIGFKGCNIWQQGGGGGQCGIYAVASWGTRRTSNGELPRLLVNDASAFPTDAEGNLVAYQSRASGTWDAYVTTTDGGVGVNISNGNSSDGLPTISPDGQWVAFVSDRSGAWAIYAARANGTGSPTKLFDFPKANPWATGDRDWTRERISWGR